MYRNQLPPKGGVVAPLSTKTVVAPLNFLVISTLIFSESNMHPTPFGLRPWISARWSCQALSQPGSGAKSRV